MRAVAIRCVSMNASTSEENHTLATKGIGLKWTRHLLCCLDNTTSMLRWHKIIITESVITLYRVHMNTCSCLHVNSLILYIAGSITGIPPATPHNVEQVDLEHPSD